MLTKAIEGYGTFYYNKHVNPLPQETVHKILRLYHNRIKCCCIEVGLTVEEEKEWDSKGAKVFYFFLYIFFVSMDYYY